MDGALLPQSQGNCYYFVTVCLFPPARYYSEEGSDLHFIREVDLASSLTGHILFRDRPLRLYPKYSPNVSLIL